MAPPTKKIEPKPREKLWTETLIGLVLFVVGLAVMGGYIWHQLSPEHSEHQPEITILGLGLGLIVVGMWWMNKKLTRELMADLTSWVAFWRRSGSTS